MGVYSFSQLESYRRCPRQYQFQYIEKPEVAQRTSVRIYLGNAVHRVLEELHKAANFGRIPDKQTMLQSYAAYWEQEGAKAVVVDAEHQTVDDFQRMGADALDCYYDKFIAAPLGKSLAVEDNITFTLPARSNREAIKFRAKIDRLWRRPDGVVEIADFKTGMSLATSEDRRFRWQMGIYQLAVHAQWPELGPLQVVQHFLTLYESIPYQFSADELEQLPEELHEEVRVIVHARDINSFPTKEGAHCGWCNYEQLCPVKRYRRTLAGEAGANAASERASMEVLATLANELFVVYARAKQAEQEVDQLKETVGKYATELGLSSVPAPAGNLLISKKSETKFITKNEQPRAHADLQALIRSWGFDDYLIPDLLAFMKDIVRRKRLTPEQQQALEPFLRHVDGVTVTVKLKRGQSSERDAED